MKIKFELYVSGEHEGNIPTRKWGIKNAYCLFCSSIQCTQFKQIYIMYA